MDSRHPTFRIWASFALLSTFVLSGLWLSLWKLGPWPLVVAVGALAAVCWPRPARGKTERKVPALGIAGRDAVLLGLALLLPVILLLLLTWNQEFPFRGDHDFHLQQSRSALGVWGLWWLPATLALLLSWRSLRRDPATRVPVLLLGAFALIGGALMGSESPPEVRFAVRYPGTFYFFTTPLTLLWSTLELDSPLLAPRLTSVLAYVAWLFALRPLLFRRWPDWRIAPFAAFFLFQKDFVYFGASAYIESWCLIFVALAVEQFVAEDRVQAWKGLFLLGFAAMIKEPAVFILAPAGLALVIGARDARERRANLTALVLSILPFSLYYLMRSLTSPERPTTLAPWGAIFNAEHFATLGRYMLYQWGPLGIVVLLASVAGSIVWAIQERRERPVLLGLWVGAFGGFAYNFSDVILLRWTGFSRVHFVPELVFGGAFLLGLGMRWQPVARGRKKGTHRLIHLTIAVAAAHAVVLVPMLASTLGPDYRRNFVEYDDTPIYYPLRQLVRLGEQGHLLGPASPVRAIRIVEDIEKFEANYWARAFPAAYPVLASRYGGLPMETYREDPSVCRCRNDEEAVMPVFVYFTNLAERHPVREAYARSAGVCRRELEASCRQNIPLEADGQLIGLLGVGMKIR